MNPLILAKHLRRLYGRRRVQALSRQSPADPAVVQSYRNDPVGYAKNILKVQLTPDQETILRSLPGRVKVNSGHGTGKSFVAAVAVSWWFDTRDPGVVITTAPTERDVIDILWTEVRLQRARAGLQSSFSGPRAPEMFHTDGHWAKGYTARRGESWQGRHRPHMLFVFDECEDVGPLYWTTTGTMYQEDADHGWLAIGNPLTTSSQSYLEDLATRPDGTPKWKMFTLSCLNHPNIVAGLRGEPAPYPDAVSMSQVEQYFKEWTSPVGHPSDRQPGDVEWPPSSERWHRPGPTFKARVLGVRPTEGVDTVWSAAAFERACRPGWTPLECWVQKFGIHIGVDASGYGDDDTAFHVRSGPLSLHHEAHNGWAPGRAAARLKELCAQWAGWYDAQACEDRPPLTAEGVTVVLEFDGGYGIGVHSHKAHFHNWGGVTAGGKSELLDPNGRQMYDNLRAEMWFEAAQKAEFSQIDLSRLSPDARDRLRVQLLTPFFEVLPNGSRRVERKSEVKKRLGRSPDDADAFLLSHLTPVDWGPSVAGRGED